MTNKRIIYKKNAETFRNQAIVVKHTFLCSWVFKIASNRMKEHNCITFYSWEFKEASKTVSLCIKFTYVKILCTCVFSRVLRHSNSNNTSYFNSFGFFGTLGRASFS
jgi:hypothetical protein